MRDVRFIIIILLDVIRNLLTAILDKEDVFISAVVMKCWNDCDEILVWRRDWVYRWFGEKSHEWHCRIWKALFSFCFFCPKIHNPGIQSSECKECLKRAGSLGGKHSWKGAPCNASCYPDGAVADEAVRQIRLNAQNPNKRFFLAVGFKRLFSNITIIEADVIGFVVSIWSLPVIQAFNNKILLDNNRPHLGWMVL